MSDPEEIAAPRRTRLAPEVPEQAPETSPDGVELAQAAGASGIGSTEGLDAGPSGPSDEGGAG
jgi:hypothetical protein